MIRRLLKAHAVPLPNIEEKQGEGEDWNSEGLPLEKFEYPPQLLAYMDSQRVRRILSGSEVIASYPGTSQYVGGGVSACGLAAMNCARLILRKEKKGLEDEALLMDLLSRSTMENIMSICSKWDSDAHLEIENIHQLPLFSKALKPASDTEYAIPCLKEFQNVLLRLIDTSDTTGKSTVAIITRPPEIIACFKLHTSTGGVFVVFDSHSRPQHPLGAGFTFNTSIHATAKLLDGLLAVDRALLDDPAMQWQAQLLAQFSSHIFVENYSSSGDGLNHDDVSETMIETNLALLASQAEASGLKTRVASLTADVRRLEDQIQRDSRTLDELRHSHSDQINSLSEDVRRLRTDIAEQTERHREEMVFQTALITSASAESRRLEKELADKDEEYWGKHQVQSEQANLLAAEVQRLEMEIQHREEMWSDEREEQDARRSAMAREIRHLEGNMREQEEKRREKVDTGQLEQVNELLAVVQWLREREEKLLRENRHLAERYSETMDNYASSSNVKPRSPELDDDLHIDSPAPESVYGSPWFGDFDDAKECQAELPKDGSESKARSKLPEDWVRFFETEFSEDTSKSPGEEHSLHNERASQRRESSSTTQSERPQAIYVEGDALLMPGNFWASGITDDRSSIEAPVSTRNAISKHPAGDEPEIDDSGFEDLGFSSWLRATNPACKESSSLEQTEEEWDRRSYQSDTSETELPCDNLEDDEDDRRLRAERRQQMRMHKLALRNAAKAVESHRLAELSQTIGPADVGVSETFDCGICLEHHPLECVAQIDACEHEFCRDSIRDYIVSKVRERRFPIACPLCTADQSGYDPEVISDIVVQQVGIPESDYATYVELQLVAFSVLTHCRQCNRSTYIDRQEYEESSILSCPLPDCAFMWCKSCQEHLLPFGPEHSCDGTLELDRLMETEGWKHCPGCQTPIQKLEGCNHMICVSPGCNTHFCYVCGDSINRGAIEEHFSRCLLFEVPEDDDFQY